MKYPNLFILVCLLTGPIVYGQDTAKQPVVSDHNQSESTAKEILNQVRRSLGGEENFEKIRSLSISGKIKHMERSGEVVGDLKIDFLAPDKYQKIEKSTPRRAEFLTLKQTVNGDQVWFDQTVHRPSGTDDGSSDLSGQTLGRNSAITSGITGMRSTATSSNSTVRNELPGDRGQERTVLGMRIPGPDGPERDNNIERLERAKSVSASRAPESNRPPDINIPDVKLAKERQVRNEAISILLMLLAGNPTSRDLRFAYVGEIEVENGKVYALDITGPDDFATRLFIDKASLHPVLLNYREFRYRNTGYVVSADKNSGPDSARLEDVEIITLQIFFSDYRKIDGIELPHQILRLSNGAPFEKWEIGKYKLNPNLKAKQFEK